ncbi:MAG: RICIN domain-containing protein [Bacteroidaceae bacterium]|nr:RICIN domain-containing protein [Bacteroidaceae bacterium]
MMTRRRTLFLAFLAGMLNGFSASGQVVSGASNAVAVAVPHATVPYRIDDPGTKLPDITWGFDLAWLSEDNVRHGILYTGADMVGIMRLSFQTTAEVGEDLQLSSAQKTALNKRVDIAKKYAPNAGVNLNSDQEAGVLEWYHVYGSQNNVQTFAPRWAALIAATKKHVEARGLKVVSVSPFNEPDYGEGQTWGWQQGSKAEMLEICRLLREDAAYANDFRDVKLCGGNTLNDDYALPWYNYSKRYLDEGNTHQLAGSFDNFAKFYQQVVADGKVGVGDELHNIMECMVGSQYGLTKGIWWGTAEHTRSQFMKATRGTRMGYAEHRDNWTAASVYRHTDGSVQGFGGTSERQAVTTVYRFAATDHDVFYNGHGPMREYLMTLPGGTGYQQGQTNAEGLVNIQGGEDIMPPLPNEPTAYKIVNRLSGHLLAPSGNNASSGTTLTQQKQVTNNKAQQWTITPFETTVGGDWCYYRIENVMSPKMYPDVYNWSLEDKGDVVLFKGGFGANEQWFIEYAGDGSFYIRSRHSAKYLQTAAGTEAQMKTAGRNVNQGNFTGTDNQKWYLIPASVTYNTVAPAVPTSLVATPQPSSVRLSWTGVDDKDLLGYTIQRSDDGGQKWFVINRYVAATDYVDNTATDAVNYQYRVLAQDKSLHLSEPSEVATAMPSMEQACIMHLTADSLTDLTPNGNHASLFGEQTLQAGYLGNAISLDGSQNFIQLPATIANSRQMTFSTWLYWRGGSTWQRIFDFGSDTDHYVFLCPKRASTNKLRLAIKNGGSERVLDVATTHPVNKWMHVAVTFSDSEITIYLNGKRVASSTTITERPADFRPIFNYVGRSQFAADPMLKGAVDDIRIYNYALTAEEIATLYAEADGVGSLSQSRTSDVSSETAVFDLSGRRITQLPLPRGIYIVGGKKVMIR